MRYKFTLEPQGVIPKGVDLEIPLTPIPETPEGGGETIRIGFCEVSAIDSWIVENNVGMKTLVMAGIGGELQQVPFPNTCFTVNIRAGLGCLKEGDVLEWAGTPSDPAAIVQVFPYNGTEGPGERPDGISFFVYLADPDYDYTSFTFEVQALLDGIPIGPLITCYCNPTLHLSAWASWCISHADAGAVPCSPSENMIGDPTPTPCVDLLIPEFAGGCHTDVFPLGLYWPDVPNQITWTVTQLTGPTLPFTFVQGICGHDLFYQEDGPSYAGTSYQLDADISAVPFGDPIILTCEVP